MNWYLAIDTASPVGSVALGTVGRPLAETVLWGRQQAAGLVPAIADQLDGAGLRFSDLAGVVVADGPGSFTGVRVAVATAQGLIAAHPHLELWAAASLLAAAAVGRRAGHRTVAAAYDAMRGEVFWAAYRFDEPLSVHVLAPPALIGLKTLEDSDHAGAAEAIVVDTVSLRDRIGSRAAVVLAPPESGPRASALLELLAMPGAVSRIEDPWSFEPDYGRPAEAQVRWEGEHGVSLPDPGGRYR